ncbi:MAG: SCO family protein [Candidatus Marinimicrobia bacterium]|nr:SCO family protein [Candidatus Neomarinimicrobiota bacterium]
MARSVIVAAVLAAIAPVAVKAVTLADSTLYPVTGILQDGDPGRSELLIRHEAVAGYMSAMTMKFKVRDWDALPGGLYEGDSVGFELVVLPGDAYIRNLTILLPNPLAPRFEPTASALHPGQTFPEGHFTDSYGRPYDLRKSAKGLRFISFIFTRCPLPTMCPLVDQKHATMASLYAKEGIGPERLEFISISFDYRYDTPEVLDEHYGWRLKRKGNWAVLSSVGHEADLRAVASAAGVEFWGIEDDAVSHTMNSVLIDEDGQVVRLFSGSDWAVQEARDAISQALESGHD